MPTVLDRRVTWIAVALAIAGVGSSCKRTEERASPSRQAQPGAAATRPTRLHASEWGVAGSLKYYQRTFGTVADDRVLPLVVALHGLGDDPENFAGLFEGLPIAARVVCLQAPEPYGRGFSWFPYRLGVSGDELAPSIRQAAAEVAGALQALATQFPAAPRSIVTGFSQGGMLSYAIAVLHPNAVQAALPIAGYLPEALSEGLDGEGTPPIFSFHGSADPVVPYRDAVATEQRLRAQGFGVKTTRYEGVEHRVSPEMRTHIHARIVHALRSPLMAPDRKGGSQ